MDFGSLADPTLVDFTLPPLTAASARVLAAGRRPSEGGAWLRIGAPVWARRDWLGSFYPRGTPPREFLAFYATRAGAIELNATFYAVPTAAVVDGWARATPESFRFCPKVPRAISHDAGLYGAAAREAFAAFCGALAPLGSRLGPLLLQLPPTFGPSRLRTLDDFLAATPPGVRVAVELRDEGWFDFGALTAEAADALERRGAIAVVTDVAGRRDVCHGSLTAPALFVRFVGNGFHPTDDARLDAWAARIAEMRRCGLDEAFFFVHQPDDRAAPDTMALFATRARARGIDLPADERRGQLALF